MILCQKSGSGGWHPSVGWSSEAVTPFASPSFAYHNYRPTPLVGRIRRRWSIKVKKYDQKAPGKRQTANIICL